MTRESLYCNVLFCTVLYCIVSYSDNDVVRLDTGEDQRVDKEEFTSDKMKETLEKVTYNIWNRLWNIITPLNLLTLLTSIFQWVGPIEDMEAEFANIDKNGGGQILLSEFIDWALEKDLDIEDDVEPEDWTEDAWNIYTLVLQQL